MSAYLGRSLCLLLCGVLGLTQPGAAGAPDRRELSSESPEHRGALARRLERSFAEVEPLLERYGYAAAAVAALGEGLGVPMPGQTLLVASSLAAAAGRMHISLVLLFVTTATALGNSIGYALGRWAGRAALGKLGVNPQRQQRLVVLFRRHGGLVVLLGRFVDGLRQLNGIVAGILQMPWSTFTAYNLVGAILWTCTWGLGSYYFGRDIGMIADLFHRPAPWLYVLGLIGAVALVVYMLRHDIPRR
jgi:membrane protein DedA with SNARE-associated domain